MLELVLMSLQLPSNPFGARIKGRRTELRLSQRALASRAGLDYTYLSKIENGRLEHTPSIRAIQGLARELQLDELELMDLAHKVPAVFESITRDREALRFFRRATETVRSPDQWRALTDYLDRTQPREELK
jgi:transcriptional regulator with XRE-family HTH domain